MKLHLMVLTIGGTTVYIRIDQWTGSGQYTMQIWIFSTGSPGGGGGAVIVLIMMLEVVKMHPVIVNGILLLQCLMLEY